MDEDEYTYALGRWQHHDLPPKEYLRAIHAIDKIIDGRIAKSLKRSPALVITDDDVPAPTMSFSNPHRQWTRKVDRDGMSAEEISKLCARRIFDTVDDPAPGELDNDDESGTGGGDPLCPNRSRRSASIAAFSVPVAGSSLEQKPTSSASTSTSGKQTRVKKEEPVEPFRKPKPQRVVHDVDDSVVSFPATSRSRPRLARSGGPPDDSDPDGDNSDDDSEWNEDSNLSHTTESTTSYSRAPTRRERELLASIDAMRRENAEMSQQFALLNAGTSGPADNSPTDSPFIPAVATWFPLGGYEGTAAERDMMGCFTPFHVQNITILKEIPRKDHLRWNLGDSLKQLGVFTNSTGDDDAQWQDFLRLIIRVVSSSNGAVAYGSVIALLRGSTLYSSAVTKELSGVFDTDGHYTEESKPWHLKTADYSSYEQCHKILCALSIFLCRRYHRVDSLDIITQRIKNEVLSTEDWSGLPILLEAQLTLFRRLHPTDQASCRIANYMSASVRDMPGDKALKMSYGQHFDTIVKQTRKDWAAQYPDRNATEAEILTNAVHEIFTDFKATQPYIKKPTKKPLKQNKTQIRALSDDEDDDDDDGSDSDDDKPPADKPSSAKLDLVSISKAETMSAERLREVNLRVNAINVAYRAAHPKDGAPRGDTKRGGGRDRPPRERDPAMDGLCYACGQPGCSKQTCKYLDHGKFMANGKTIRWNYALLHGLAPPTKKSVLDTLRSKGRCRSMNEPKWAAFRARLEAPTWVPSADDA
jgi:hypothetical protein